jgi:hypothetical protein
LSVERFADGEAEGPVVALPVGGTECERRAGEALLQRVQKLNF